MIEVSSIELVRIYWYVEVRTIIITDQIGFIWHTSHFVISFPSSLWTWIAFIMIKFLSFSRNIQKYLTIIYYILRITEFIEMFFKDKILRLFLR